MTPQSGWRHVFAGTNFAIALLLGVFGGLWVDRQWQSEPWGVLVGAILGMAAGFYNLLREFKDDPKA